MPTKEEEKEVGSWRPYHWVLYPSYRPARHYCRGYYIDSTARGNPPKG